MHLGDELKKPLRVSFYSAGAKEPAQVRAHVSDPQQTRRRPAACLNGGLCRRRVAAGWAQATSKDFRVQLLPVAASSHPTRPASPFRRQFGPPSELRTLLPSRRMRAACARSSSRSWSSRSSRPNTGECASSQLLHSQLLERT